MHLFYFHIFCKKVETRKRNGKAAMKLQIVECLAVCNLLDHMLSFEFRYAKEFRFLWY